MPTLLARNATVVVTMDGDRRELQDAGLFARDGFIDRIYGGGGSDSAQIDNTSAVKDLLSDIEIILP